ncbi:hypothetical protein XENOCAPTIV_010063 [Xenoophorus captivus]|uniref:WH1 domain-containing protein n=1 Tax=Xenoophorus captivus TaxID=1517983 RepID=A0ABV0QR18_9TELE
MNSHPPLRRAVNVGSLLLTPQENECLFGYLGRKCAVSSAVCLPLCRLELEQVRSAQVRLKNHVFPRPLESLISSCSSNKPCTSLCSTSCLPVCVQTLCSAVVQVYRAERSYKWVKRCCGVACLVKDNPQRSYFIRVFDIKSCQVGLNFASEEEAKRFRVAVGDLLNRRQRKTGEVLRLSSPCIALSRCDHSASNFKNLHPLPDVTEACWVVLLYKLFSFKHKLWNIVREEIPGLRLQNIRGCFRMQL